MKSFEIRSWRTLLIGASAALLSLPSSAASSQSCNRACMRTVLDQYMNAVFAHDPKKAPLAAHSRATENAVLLPDGTGIWLTATNYGAVQRRYFDTTTGEAAYFGIVDEGAQPMVLSLRLKIENKKVTEAEWTVARKDYGGLFSPQGLTELPPPPDTPLPKAERTSRADLIAAADAYFDGLQTHDGSHIPHVSGCERIENGVKVTNRSTATPLGRIPDSAPATAPAASAQAPSAAQEIGAAAAPASPPGQAPSVAQESRSGDCTSGFERFAKMISETTHRRYPVVDEEAGVVLGLTLFHRPPGVTMKRNLLSEFFWEKQGKITAIHSAMFYMDANAPDTPGWD